jgi:hypothetical protein
MDAAEGITRGNDRWWRGIGLLVSASASGGDELPPTDNQLTYVVVESGSFQAKSAAVPSGATASDWIDVGLDRGSFYDDGVGLRGN